MSDWLPIGIGFAIIFIATLIARHAPHSNAGRELRTSYGVTPTGPRGERTRRDQFRSAALASVIGLGLLFTAFGVGAFGQRFPNGTRANLAAMTYTFAAFLLCLMAFIVAALGMWKGAVWHVELPDWPEHRVAFADAMDRVIDRQSTPDQEAVALGVRYQQRIIEEFRRASLRALAKYKGDLPANYRDQFKEFTARIRESAG